MFSDSILKEIEVVRDKYPDRKSALIPSLYIAQREYGWLSNEALRLVADNLKLPEATVRATASFYSLFKNKPTGRHIIQLCTNVSCMILGSEKLQDILGIKYGLEPGGITADGRFSLIIVECIGTCDGAPSMLVNEDSYVNLTEQNIDVILGKYR